MCSNSAAYGLLCLVLVWIGPAFAQGTELDTESPPPPTEDVAPPYEDQLERLSEVLGSLHFLRQICEGEEAEDWRENMAAFLAAEQPSPRRRAKFIGLFNRGYDGFSGQYTRCTPQAMQATRRYLREGRSLSEGIVNRYGN
ncbi:MAG: TIGR02301 family protein [Pseudomonadota bacterium]